MNTFFVEATLCFYVLSSKLDKRHRLSEIHAKKSFAWASKDGAGLGCLYLIKKGSVFSSNDFLKPATAFLTAILYLFVSVTGLAEQPRADLPPAVEPALPSETGQTDVTLDVSGPVRNAMAGTTIIPPFITGPSDIYKPAKQPIDPGKIDFSRIVIPRKTAPPAAGPKAVELPVQEDLTPHILEIVKSAPMPEEPLTPLPERLRAFIVNKLVPTESIYFAPGFGLDPLSGMPFDHVRIRLKKGIRGEVGNYTAASKLSLSIPYLLGIIQRKTAFENAKIKPPEAEEILTRTLTTIRTYVKKFPDYEGFLPWVDIRPNGTIAPATTKVPSLDNGQFSWALAAVVAAFEDSPSEHQRAIAARAQEIVNQMNYGKFYDTRSGRMHGTIQKDPHTSQWSGDKTYYLKDMFEGTLAVLWGVLHGQIPEEAWYNLEIPTVDYQTSQGEKVTTFQGFRASFHEHWALVFLPFMESDIAPLYWNYLYVQADFSRSHKLPGFQSTAYDAQGTYRQMGIPAIADNPVDRSDVSVLFATAMSMLISPAAGIFWVKNLYEFGQMLSPLGAVESVATDGYADIFTADAKGMTLLAVTGGVVPEIKKYLKTRTMPKTGVSMYIKFMELLHAKYLQMLEARKGLPVYMPKKPFPLPAKETIRVTPKPLPTPGPEFNITQHLQPGHLHGKNVRSVDQSTLEDDLRPAEPFEFEFEIPAFYPYFDQWAFRGTYVDQAVSIANMRYFVTDIPADSPPSLYEIEIKSDDIALATVIFDTTQEGVLSADGKWKTIVKKISVIPESAYKPFNYFAVAIHDPRYLLGKFVMYGRQGIIELNNIRLTEKHPFGSLTEIVDSTQNSFGDFELMRYWRMSHGSLPFERSDESAAYRFSGGLGWRGGYVPYTDMAKFDYLYVKVKNLGERRNVFNIELKHENDQLFGFKVPVRLPKDKDWHVFEIELPKDVEKPLNYLALSDPQADFELEKISLSHTRLSLPDTEITVIDAASRKPLQKNEWQKGTNGNGHGNGNGAAKK